MSYPSNQYTTTPSASKTTEVTVRNLNTDSYKITETSGRNITIDYEIASQLKSTESSGNVTHLNEVVINNIECEESNTDVALIQDLYVSNVQKNSSQTKINLVDPCQFNEDVVMDKDLQVNGGDITSTGSTLNIGASVTDLNLSSTSGTTTINNNLTNLKLSISDVVTSTSSYNSNQVIVLVSPLAELTLTIDSNLNVNGKILIIKDVGGSAGSFNIIVKPEDSSIAIDGLSTATISSHYGAVRLFSNGNQWYTF